MKLALKEKKVSEAHKPMYSDDEKSKKMYADAQSTENKLYELAHLYNQTISEEEVLLWLEAYGNQIDRGNVSRLNKNDAGEYRLGDIMIALKIHNNVK